MQWLLDKNKHLPCFPSKRGNLQAAILFMLATAAAIITQVKSYKISFYVDTFCRNALSKWSETTSWNVFSDDTGVTLR